MSVELTKKPEGFDGKAINARLDGFELLGENVDRHGAYYVLAYKTYGNNNQRKYILFRFVLIEDKTTCHIDFEDKTSAETITEIFNALVELR